MYQNFFKSMEAKPTLSIAKFFQTLNFEINYSQFRTKICKTKLHIMEYSNNLRLIQTKMQIEPSIKWDYHCFTKKKESTT